MTYLFALLWFFVGHHVFMFFLWLVLLSLAIESGLFFAVGMTAAIVAWVVFMFGFMSALNRKARVLWMSGAPEGRSVPTSLEVTTGIELAFGSIFIMLGIMSENLVFLGLAAVSLIVYAAVSIPLLARKYKKSSAASAPH